MKYVLAIIAFFLSTLSVSALHNANLDGTVTQLNTYDNGAILFKISTQPTSHPACNHVFFAIETTNEDCANRMYSLLLTAQNTGATIKVGYDNAGNCAIGYIRTHMVRQ